MPPSDVKERVTRKVTWRLLPLLYVSFMVAFLDRVNVGFAKETMGRDLGLSSTVYGLGAGLFFLGYFLCEVPSNLMLVRVGARVWIARIMLVWGVRLDRYHAGAGYDQLLPREVAARCRAKPASFPE